MEPAVLSYVFVLDQLRIHVMTWTASRQHRVRDPVEPSGGYNLPGPGGAASGKGPKRPPNVVALYGLERLKHGRATARPVKAADAPADTLHAVIGAQLRKLYHRIEEEPLPERFVELLRRLERSND